MVGGRPTGDRQVTVRTPSIGRSLPGRRPEKLLRIYQIFREIARGPIGDQQGTAQASVGFNSLLNFSKRSPSVLYVQRRPSVLTDRPVAVLKCDLSLNQDLNLSHRTTSSPLQRYNHCMRQNKPQGALNLVT